MHLSLKTSTLWLCLALCGCGGVNGRYEKAQSLAAPAQMTKQEISAPPFLLTAYTRTTKPGENAHVYIEGDGLAWTGRRSPSLDPTPINPLALELATLDDASNVVYLARPCQYSKMADPEPCPMKYWTDARFAPEVISSMNAALSDIKQDHNIKNFELIGFSGGGGVAALLAAQREDVSSLRTVAGNLDHELVMRLHHVSPLKGSLNAVNIAVDIADIPQLHFIGAEDALITPDIAHSFMKASGPTNCIHIQIVQNAAHEKGWPNQWPALLKVPLDCSN